MKGLLQASSQKTGNELQMYTQKISFKYASDLGNDGYSLTSKVKIS
uniref:Uncharacterized protein n=1 Tax=Arundo donax TaxID=35708 RepID=A0A0A8XXP5_ARUDO